MVIQEPDLSVYIPMDRRQALVAGHMQTPKGTAISLTIKVALAHGPARRFLVGNPEQRYFDILAGATVARMAAAESLAQKGEVVVTPEITHKLDDSLTIAARRSDEAGTTSRLQPHSNTRPTHSRQNTTANIPTRRPPCPY